MADEFFARFKAQLEPEAAPAEAAAAEEAAAKPKALSPYVWVAGLIALVIILLFVFGGQS